MRIKLVIVLFLGCTVLIFSQGKPRLGILPFSGSSRGDGETIAILFADDNNIKNTFEIIDRNTVSARMAELNFQLSGYTNSDTIARLGNELGVDYIISGHIRRLGNSNLIIATIVNVETFELLTGDYRTYGRIEEVRRILPAISEKMVAASRRTAATLPTLAISLFNIVNTGVNAQDAETLAEILAIEISNTGIYSVLPRTSVMQDAMAELQYQQSNTNEEMAKRLGQAANADFVISGEIRRLGSENLFTAQILHVEDGRQIASGTRDYRNITDGIELMAELALLLTYPDDAESRIARLRRQRSRSTLFDDPAKFWSIGVSTGTSFADPWLIGTIRATIAPFRYSFLELGCDIGFFSSIEDAEYYSLYPFIHYALFLPFTGEGGWYIGAGGGCMIAEYRFGDYSQSKRIFSADFTVGVNLWNVLDISYTLRTDFSTASNKLAVGFSYRF